MAAAGGGHGSLHRPAEIGAGECSVVIGGITLASRGPVIEVLELDVENRRLQLIQPEVSADERVKVFGLAAMDAQDVEPLRQGRIVGDAHAGVAESSQVLGRKERQATHIAVAAGTPAGGIL